MKGIFKTGSSRERCDGESEVRGVLGREVIVGRLIDRVARRFVGSCIARRDIVSPSMCWRRGDGFDQAAVIDSGFSRPDPHFLWHAHQGANVSSLVFLSPLHQPLKWCGIGSHQLLRSQETPEPPSSLC